MTDTTYATGRVYLDADSHVVETEEWLAPFADPALRSRLRPLDFGKGGGEVARKALERAERRAASGGSPFREGDTVMTAKGWTAYGAFDKSERTAALDLLGFHRQLVFSTFAPLQFESERDLDLLYGGAAALTRAMAAFCADDDRLMPVATLPLSNPQRSLAALREAIDLGCPTVVIPSKPRATVSPTHPDFDPVWDLLAEADVPFMLHIGGGGNPIPRTFHDNGRQVTDWLGGGENLRAKDFMGVHHTAEVFLGAMILDGVFERFAGLRGGCIELGAMWVVDWLMRLDIAQSNFVKSEPALNMPMKASEYAHRQLWFTPFPTEPVGWMIEQAGNDMFLFSSDYPHPEGGRDPLKRFESSMANCSDEDRDRFYAGNFAEMMGMEVPALT
jgi:predicted TIM-barrel fold metal-dependent hydrolase